MEDILNICSLSISEKPDTDTVDRLSSLPDHLLSQILSKLPTDFAVATSVLSSHWRYQWTNITRIYLYSPNISNCHELRSFLTTVDNILRKLSSPLNNLRTFYLNFSVPESDIGHSDLEDDNAYELCRTFLSQWLHRLCSSRTERFEVFELLYNDGCQGGYLTVRIKNSEFLSRMSDSGCSRRIESSLVVDKFLLCFPECIFQNKTLVELKITINFPRKLPNYLHLPNLKILSLQIYSFDRQSMPTIFKSLPLLEDLSVSVFLGGGDHFIDISAPNLKSFSIIFKRQDSPLDSQANVLIDAPKLKHISIISAEVFVLFRFVKIPIDLLTTTLGYWSVHGEDIGILEIVKAISYTRSLDLWYHILNVTNSYELPTFHNLVELSLVLSDVEDMNLAIPASILGKLKTIKVQELEGYEKELRLMEDILSKAMVLEWLCIFALDVEEPEKDSLIQKQNDFIKALFMLPRVSSCCEIEFCSQFVYASTK